MRRYVAIDVIELFLAESNNGNRDRNKIAITTQGIIDRFVIDRTRVLFNEHPGSRSELLCITPHHLDGKRAGKCE